MSETLQLTEEDARSLLASTEAELTPCIEGALGDLKSLREACLGAGIPAAIGAPGDCGTGKCAPKAQLLVRDEDVPRVQALLRGRWEDAVRELGVEPAKLGGEAGPGEELPCPACGTAGPLLAGACSDCGLQLE
jgi:hypothetical protein